MQPLAAPDVNDIRIRNRNRERTDRSGRLIVEDRVPGAAKIVAPENAAVYLREIE